jgi:hypothetical protein
MWNLKYGADQQPCQTIQMTLILLPLSSMDITGSVSMEARTDMVQN